MNDANVYRKYLPNTKIIKHGDSDYYDYTDVNIFLEIIENPKLLKTAKLNVLMVNQEQPYINHKNIYKFRMIDIVFVKSKHAIYVVKK